MKSKSFAIAAVAALCALSSLPVLSAGPSPAPLAGEKIDSGLGALPHYSRWADPRGRVIASAVPGESLDDGLGQLPHYRTWVDRSGKNPTGKPVRVASN